MTTKSLASAVQGDTYSPQVITWEKQNLTGATVTAVKQNLSTRAVTAVTGTITVTSSTSEGSVFSWAYSEADTGTAGRFVVQFQATYPGDASDATMRASWYVEPLLLATAVAAPLLVGVTAAQAAALDAANAPSGSNAVATMADIPTAAGDVDDLTTTTGNSGEMVRVAAAGGLEYRTPANVLGDIGAEPALGNPAANGDILSSLTDGTRSWVTPSSGGLTSQAIAAAQMSKMILWDTFNRADGALGTADSGEAWTAVKGAWAINGGLAQNTGASSDALPVIVGLPITQILATSSLRGRVLVRGQQSGSLLVGIAPLIIDADNFVVALLSVSTLTIRKYVAGVETILTTKTVDVTQRAGGLLEFTWSVGREGTALRVSAHVNGEGSVVTATILDAVFDAAGQCGLAGNTNATAQARWSDFAVWRIET